MLVEDEADTARLVMSIMEHDGYRVIHAADGRQAIKFVKSMSPPSLVLLDMLLPYADGIKVLSHIRLSRLAWRDVPVVMLSANNSARDIRESLILGASDYILKPFTQETLVARLRRFRPYGTGEPTL